MPQTPRVERSTLRFASRTFRLVTETVRFPEGDEFDVHVLRHPGAVAVLPLLLRPLRVVLLSQYRHAVGRAIWEIPAGTRDRPGEAPLDCARRELVEETGYSATRFATVARFYSAPGFCDELMHLYAAWGLEPGEPLGREPDERIEVHELPWPRVQEMAHGGELEDAKTLVAVYWLEDFLRGG